MRLAFPCALLLGWLAPVLLPLPAAAAPPLRSPQVTFCSDRLNDLFQSYGLGIDPISDQVDAQARDLGPAPTAWLIILEHGGDHGIGLYDADAVGTPALFEALHAGALVGSYSIVHLLPDGRIAVARFDENGVFVDTELFTSTPGTFHHFGLYVSDGQGQIVCSQDARNDGHPGVLTYLGTGQFYGDWFDCFETHPAGPACPQFVDVVVQMEPVEVNPTRQETWGGVKTRFH